MCLQWTRVLYSVVITTQSNPTISQYNSLCNEYTSLWSMFAYHIMVYTIHAVIIYTQLQDI